MYTQLSIPNIPPKAVYQRSGRRRTEAPEEDRADSSATSVTLFASKQEAGGRSCLFPCRCRSCFRELPLTSTPGVSSPLWLSAPTPVRHLFFFFFLLSSLSLLPATHPPCRSDSGSAMQTRPAFARCRCACSGESCRRTHPLGHAHALLRLLLEALTESLTTAGRLLDSKEASQCAPESPD